MKHLTVLIGIAITSVIVAVANLIVERMVGINIFSFKLWFIIPVGAALIGFAASSGGLLAARVFNIVPNAFDAIAMIVLAGFTMFLIYYLDYATLILDDGRKVSALVSFLQYVDLTLTTQHLRVGRTQIDTGQVGELGYWLAVSELIGFLIGGLSSFLILFGMARCSECPTYLRKLKSKKSNTVTIDEAAALIEGFSGGDLKTIQEILGWQPDEGRKLQKNEKQAHMIYELWACPNCKLEQVVAKINVFNGKEWSEVTKLTTKRNVPFGDSLRQQFLIFR